MKLRICVSIGLMTAPLGVVWAQQVDPMAPLPPATGVAQPVAPVEVAPVLPPAIWQIADAEQLLAFILFFFI